MWLYENWTEGIRTPNADPAKIERIASLRWLEFDSCYKTRIAWRSGANMRKAVAQRKVLIYAILRGLPDPKGVAGMLDCHVNVSALPFVPLYQDCYCIRVSEPCKCFCNNYAQHLSYAGQDLHQNADMHSHNIVKGFYCDCSPAFKLRSYCAESHR